jgi:hypothetical protein
VGDSKSPCKGTEDCIRINVDPQTSKNPVLPQTKKKTVNPTSLLLSNTKKLIMLGIKQRRIKTNANKNVNQKNNAVFHPSKLN